MEAMALPNLFLLNRKGRMIPSSRTRIVFGRLTGLNYKVHLIHWLPQARRIVDRGVNVQFVKNGPDIPERLLQAHEEGRVVFFCGAGISYPARLPGFRGLVELLYEGLGVTRTAIENSALKSSQFDTAIGLLESRIVGGRATVRRELARILTPDLTLPEATETHEALLIPTALVIDCCPYSGGD
jgi:hypothetical protein